MTDEVISIKLGQITWYRDLAREPRIVLVNRYFEDNPTNQVDRIALLVRPALTRRNTEFEAGPVRAVYQQDGTFGNDAFVVSATELYRVNKFPERPDIVTQIDGEVWKKGLPSLSAARTPDSEFLFVATGRELWVYDPAVGEEINQVVTPDDVPITSLAYIAGYTICVVGASQRFFWIEPGEKTIDSLNFAEAERTPDWLLQALPLGDQFGLFGKKTSEFWYPTGDPLAPFQRLQGRMYDRGIFDGTAQKVGDSVILVGEDGVVYSVENGPERISYNGLEERIRTAMRTQVSELARAGLED